MRLDTCVLNEYDMMLGVVAKQHSSSQNIVKYYPEVITSAGFVVTGFLKQ